MEITLFNWLFNMFETLGSFGNWLISPIQGDIFGMSVNLGWSPLGLLSVGGITAIVLLHVWHLIKLVF